MCSQKCARPEMLTGSDKEPTSGRNNQQRTLGEGVNSDKTSVLFCPL